MKAIAKIRIESIEQPEYRSRDPQGDDDDDPGEDPTSILDERLEHRIKRAVPVDRRPLVLVIEESDGVLSIRVDGSAGLSASQSIDLSIARVRRHGFTAGRFHDGNPMVLSVEEP